MQIIACCPHTSLLDHLSHSVYFFFVCRCRADTTTHGNFKFSQRLHKALVRPLVIEQDRYLLLSDNAITLEYGTTLSLSFKKYVTLNVYPV